MKHAFQFALSPSYGVTANGDVVRIAAGGGAQVGRVLRPALRGKSGYLCVNLWENGKGKTWFVHEIVALTFHGPRPARHEVAHNDGNKLHNHYTNLRWATRSDNQMDRVAHGTSNRGRVKYHCPAGHAYTAENSGYADGGRYCLECRRVRARLTYAARKAVL